MDGCFWEESAQVGGQLRDWLEGEMATKGGEEQHLLKHFAVICADIDTVRALIQSERH